jgi:RHS repeat-associated protein
MPDVTLLLIAPLLIAAIIHKRKGRRWSEPAATALLAVTVVVIGMALSGGGAVPAVAVPAPMPFLSPPPPPPGCTLPTAPITGTRVISYTYDPLGRLSQAAQSDGACYQYKYDPVGNRTALTTTAGVTTYSYDAANRLTSVGGQTYTWSNTGNLTSNGVKTFTYNQANQMTRAQGITATQVYTYNGDGLLMARNTSKYVWDQAADLPQMLSDGSVLYVPGVGQWDGKDWTYELPDGLGSVRQLADAQGYIAQRYEYGPFGEALASEGKRTNSLRYTGEQWDSDVGLLYLRARWYDPSVGRFTTRDPFLGLAGLPQTQNLYVYVYNNPINLTDPGGDNPIIIALVVVGGIVVISGGVILYTYYSSPYAAQNRANLASGMCELGRGVQSRYDEVMAWPTVVITLGSEAIRSGINVLMHKGEYVPSGLSGDARNAYREAIHRYKKVWGMAANQNVPKEICDEIANLVKEGVRPADAADQVDGPPEDN